MSHHVCPHCGTEPPVSGQVVNRCDECGWSIEGGAPCTTDVSPAARAVSTYLKDTRPEDQRKADARPAVEALGWSVHDFEQGWRPKKCRKCGERIPGGGTTRVPKGVGDWLCMKNGISAWLEWKTDDNQQTPGQRAWQRICEANRVPYAVVRTTREAVDYLESLTPRRAA